MPKHNFDRGPVSPLLEGDATYTFAEYFWTHVRTLAPFAFVLTGTPFGPVTQADIELVLAIDDVPQVEAELVKAAEELDDAEAIVMSEWRLRWMERREASIAEHERMQAVYQRRLASFEQMRREVIAMPVNTLGLQNIQRAMLKELDEELTHINQRLGPWEGSGYESVEAFRASHIEGHRRRVMDREHTLATVKANQEHARTWLRGLVAAVPPPEAV
jgi:hypothetical protein